MYLDYAANARMTWSVPEAERIATLENEMKNVAIDVGEIKSSLASLQKIASQGSGALKTALKIGGGLGWAIALFMGILNYFHSSH